MPDYLSVTMLDGFGRTTNRRYEMTEQLLLADYKANAQLLVTALGDITDLQIIKAVLLIDGALTLPETDPEGSNVDVGATFSGYLGAGAGKKGSLKVPGIKLEYVDTLGNIDVTDADIDEFLDLFGDPPDNKFKISDGEYVESWIGGTLDS